MADHLNDALPPTRAGAVAADLRRQIQTGELPPGSRLRQMDVAERYGVSTTPVREAFVTLAREGIVRQDAHRGVVVFAPSADELAEIYEIRAVLEPLATRIAAAGMSEETLAELEGIVERMRSASPADYAQLNSRLHTTIYRAADRPRLLDMIENLRQTASAYLTVAITRYSSAYLAEIHEEHEEIVAALREGTAVQAARAVRLHLEHSARETAALIDAE